MQFEVDGGMPDNLSPAHASHTASAPGSAAQRAELEWVLAHPEISRSANLVRFLSFICSKYFEGATSDIREHTIATEALGRKRASFDSHADPIVRVTARTLRKKLDLIYSTDGLARPLRIVLPVGHYVPEFVPATAPRVAQTDEPDEPEASTVAAPAEIPATVDAAESAIAAKSGVRVPRRWTQWWKPTAAVLIIPAIFLAGFLIGRRQDHSPHVVGEGFNWGAPAWSDEFDGAARQLPDPAKWTFDLSAPEGVSLHDRRVYCSPRGGRSGDCDPRYPNAFLDGAGHLVLRVLKNSSSVWTMARINTKGRKEFQYGRIEARMKMPVGAGLRPSFIIFGANVDTVPDRKSVV